MGRSQIWNYSLHLVGLRSKSLPSSADLPGPEMNRCQGLVLAVGKKSPEARLLGASRVALPPSSWWVQYVYLLSLCWSIAKF